MKTLTTLLTLLVASASIAQNAVAKNSEPYQHFPALESPNTQVALCHLTRFNQQLKAITDKPELSAQDMVKVHQLTYTLENALMRLQTDLKDIAADLETVHIASEQLDAAAIKSAGDDYLQALDLLLNPKSCP
ncbi:hypothetical protein QWY77_06240 [Thalassotalea ponticola]|uniref:DUF6746 family protein n=1 Tax=Thalassotalea ponticola TaxID=1523392 RepID=UPI0025B5AA08|nr:DUF6746 family protein [Thalassotalea ponticola]MDN3652360.1 hypothetical protein [Thalassotalea ponticola]